MKYLVGFVRFWYDFIVGDAWEVAVGVVVALALAAWLVRQAPVLETGLGPLFFLAVCAVLVASLWREVRPTG